MSNVAPSLQTWKEIMLLVEHTNWLQTLFAPLKARHPAKGNAIGDIYACAGRKPIQGSLRKPILGMWLLAVLLIAFAVYVVFEGDVDRITLQLSLYSQNYKVLVWFGYLLILSVRGLTFVPSTPLLLLGLSVFSSHLLYATNLLGILFSSSFVIFLVNRSGIRQEVGRIENARFRMLERTMRRHGFLAVVLWSLFPLVLTDVIVYVSSAVGMSKKKILLGIMTGEAVLMAIYVYGGHALLEQTAI